MTDIHAHRLARVQAALAASDASSLLVTTPANVRWLSGFTTPEDARVLVTKDAALLVTDGRYIAQAEQESQLETVITRDWINLLQERTDPATLGIEADHVTVATLTEMTDKLGLAPKPTRGLVTDLRLIKDAAELDSIRAAAALTDRAFEHALTVLKPGVREIDVALAIEHFVRSEGGDGMAFEIIVASGPRSAMPHGVASTRVIEAGELVTIDMGARVAGYCADMTRTVGVGQVSDAHRALFEAVLESQIASLAAVGPDKATKDVDAVARDILTGHGLGEAFAHSLGHGVGLDIHEAPGLSPRSEDVLKPGMVVTIEPGAYHPGDAGVRVEDLAVVTEEGHEVLSHAPKTWRTVGDA